LDAILDAADSARAADLYRAQTAMRNLCASKRLPANWSRQVF
jgi:hypothetical protein